MASPTAAKARPGHHGFAPAPSVALDIDDVLIVKDTAGGMCIEHI